MSSTTEAMDIWLAIKNPELSVGEALAKQKMAEQFPWQPAVKQKLGIEKHDEIDGVPNFTNSTQPSDLYREQLRVRRQIEEMHRRDREEMELNQQIQRLHEQHIKQKSTERVTQHFNFMICEPKTVIV